MDGKPIRPQVRPVAPSDIGAVATMLARSFDDDPVSNFIFCGDRRRRRGLYSFFATMIRRQYLPFGHVYMTHDGSGAAIWGPPNRPRHPIRELLQLAPTGPYLVGRRGISALRYLGEVDALHPKEPHWYLGTLGADVDCQGKGIGSALLTDGLARIDEAGMPAYLESSKERNVPLYARFGFEVIGEIRSTVGGPPMWRMWREPRIPGDYDPD